MSNNPDCARCKQLEEVVAQAEEANTELARQVTGLQRLLTRAGQTEVALRNELARQREEEPEAEAIKAVLNHWKRRLGHEKAKTPLSGARAQKVRARLRDRFTVDDLKRAVDGCARVPYVGPGGRKPTGNRRERHDDLALICRDEETVERFMSYAEDSKPRLVVGEPTGIDAILGRLEGVRSGRAGHWEARCPAHDDKHASLSIAQGRVGAVVHCHAGCTIDEIAQAAGIEVGQLFDPDPAATIAPARPPEPLPSDGELERWAVALGGNRRLLERIAELRRWSASTLRSLNIGFDGQRLTLPVYGADGTLVNVLRYLPRRTDGQRKLLAARGRPRDLFPAPESVSSTELWLVEGEPDAISGRELGLPVVAVPGVNGWRNEWAARLAGRRVTICMDCDEPGRAAAERILRSLVPHVDARILDLEPERTDGYDLSDALLEGADGELLRVMAAAIVEQRVAA